MKVLALLIAALALASCGTAGGPPKPQLIANPTPVAMPVAVSCVPANLPTEPADKYPRSVDDALAQWRAAPDDGVRYQLAASWALGELARLVLVEPVVSRCRDKAP